MKKILVLIAIIFSTGYLLSCKENKAPAIKSEAPGRKTNRESNISKPPATNLSPRKVQDQINKEIHDALLISNDSITGEAAIVIAETHNAIRHLIDSNYAAATKAIENAIGKSEVVTTLNRGNGLAPLTRDVIVRDLVADLQTLNDARHEVEDFIDKGYLQDARRLANLLVSEIYISTSSIPLQTYPAALKKAVELSKEKKLTEAALILNTALNTIVVQERYIPLPLIRAELMLATADSLITAKNNNEVAIDAFLDNADYQIRFAEELGYGKRDKEFEELYDAIKNLKKEVKKKNADNKSLISSLRKKLTAFKNRITPETETKK
jgi:hypothetical protein